MPEESVGQHELHFNLRGSQANFLYYLSSILAVDASEVFAQLIDSASLPEAEKAELALHQIGVLPPKSGSRTGRRWVKQSIFLDDQHIERLEQIRSESGVSESGALRHLLASFKAQLGASHQDGSPTLFARTWSAFSAGKYGFAMPVFVLLLVIASGLFFALRKESSIEYAPHWGGERATVILDLHTHTRYSDGALTPGELVDLASAEGCDALVISDHADVSGALSDEQFQELRNLRISHPNMLLFAGVELNMPSSGGREHVGLIAQPGVEGRTLRNLRDIAQQAVEEEKNNAGSGSPDAHLLQTALDFQSLWGGLLMVYNHPSREATNPAHITSNLIRWNTAAPFLSLMEGAPGHQNAPVTGSYNKPHLTVDRWDPAVAEVGGGWDDLWSQGHQIWGALASSDYHNQHLDKPPCSFSRTHVIVPERSYRGVILALKSGTFWADHGRILDQLWFTVGLEGLEQVAYPGSTVTVGNGKSVAEVGISIERGLGSQGLPLVVEIIGNCETGSTEVLAAYPLPAGSTDVSGRVPLRATGQDEDSCFLRARVRRVVASGADLLAYTNPVKLRL